MQSSLERACQELGLTIVAPFSLTVREGVRVDAQALLPQLGAPKGMIVVSKGADLQGVTSELDHMGYGYSVMSEPRPAEDFDLETWVDVFSDWGWSSSANEAKPVWMHEGLD